MFLLSTHVSTQNRHVLVTAILTLVAHKLVLVILVIVQDIRLLSGFVSQPRLAATCHTGVIHAGVCPEDIVVVGGTV